MKIYVKFAVVTEFSKDRESTDCPKDHTPNSREVSSATGGNAGNTGERTKRARRARPDVSWSISFFPTSKENFFFVFRTVILQFPLHQ